MQIVPTFSIGMPVGEFVKLLRREVTSGVASNQGFGRRLTTSRRSLMIRVAPAIT
jgi:hypothetical protein